MPILSRRSQSQYSRQTCPGQSSTAERRKRHSNAVHPTRSTVDSHNLARTSTVYQKGTTRPVLEHSLIQCQSQDVRNMTCLPEVNYSVNGGASRTDCGSLCPLPPRSSPPLTYYCRPDVARQRRMPADNQAREREALKRQQRLQVCGAAANCSGTCPIFDPT